MTGSATESSPVRAHVLTVSTSVTAGSAVDCSGPVLVEGLRELGFDVADAQEVADGPAVGAALAEVLKGGTDVVLLSGGTGLTPDDDTPEQVGALLDRQVPGISEALRADGSSRGVATSALSRGVSGVAGSTLVVSLPGSPGACRDAMELLAPLLPHAVAQLRGDHRHAGGRPPAPGAT